MRSSPLFRQQFLLQLVPLFFFGFLLPFTSQGAVPTWKWDADGDPAIGIPPTATPGSGSWSTSSALWNNGTSDVGWTNGNGAQFGAASGADGIYAIDIDSSVTGASDLIFNSSGFNLSSTAPLSLTMSGGIAISSGKTATIGSNLTLAYAGSLTVSTGNLIIASGGKISSASGDTAISQANVQIDSGGTLEAGRLLISGSSGSLLTVNGGAVAFSGVTLFLGQAAGGSGNAVLSSGSITATSATAANGVLQYGPTNSFTGSASGQFDLDGGTLTVAQIKEGVATAQITSTFNFNGGTLKAKNSTAAGNTFMTGLDTANVRNGGAIIDTNGQTITIGQNLVHSSIPGDNAIDGGLTKKSSGTLILSGSANTYTGNTRIEAGTLTINTAYLYDQSDVLISSGATFSLNFSGIDTINALYLNGIAQAVGTWGAVGTLGVDFTSSQITGTGVLNVTAIPEPGTIGLLLLAGALGIYRRKQLAPRRD